MKKIRAVVLLGLVIATAAFTSLVVTTANVQRVGPHFSSAARWDSVTGGQAGGLVVYALAADSEKIGDVVYWSSDNHVSKSATIADYNAIAGVVVGGARQSMRPSYVAADVGTLAATANQRIIILKEGRAWVANDTVAAGITAGTRIQPSIYVAGKVKAAASSIDSLARTFGRIVIGGAASTTVLADITVK